MMTSKEIRQSFLDFFKEKEHTIVPSSSLMPESPGLLFTNAGMNQFVPFFLGTQKAPYDPPRAADTQKCIRAGGKHNDLEDVGFDTYHQTLFEMLGNWSFGNYFKKEAIEWAWELLVERWGFPPERLYATVYKPGDGDPAEFDQEAHDHWKSIFEKAGLDPAVHIINGNKKDNFWMMGDTGPCGPCSEVHVDLTPEGNTGGKLVNADDARCIELWNLVFIQYNAEADGSFRPLPSCHVDTGMGFERACSMMQGTKGFTDFSTPISNYETDVFRPIFDAIEKASGKTYGFTLPESRDGLSEQEQIDFAFRVIADHVRTLSFAIADGIKPGNGGRNYVLRRILRRAVKFGRTLGLGKNEPFLSKLVPTLVSEFGGVFPEIAEKQKAIAESLDAEEALFSKTLDRGLKLFERELSETKGHVFSGDAAFDLDTTYGFPIDLTELMATEQGLQVDMARYKERLEEHQAISKGDGDAQVIAALDHKTEVETDFTGFTEDESKANVVEVLDRDGLHFAIVDRCPLYAEKGGQVSDTGVLVANGDEINITGVSQIGAAFCLALERKIDAWTGEPLEVGLKVDGSRRRSIEGHHTATHIMHWALHEVVGPEVAQQGSLVAPDRLRFDFNSDALGRDQIAKVEEHVNAKVGDDDLVTWTDVPHADVKDRADVMQFFGDKYGDVVRVVQIGGGAGALDGYSMELCGGTHVRKTGEIGLFKIKSEGAIAAGIRRIEAVCGDAAVAYVNERIEALKQEIAEMGEKLATTNGKLGEGALDAPEFSGSEADVAALENHRNAMKEAAVEAEKKLKKSQGAAASKQASALLEETIANADGAIVESFEGDAQLMQELLNTLKKKQFGGVAVLTIPADDGKVHIGIYVHADRTGDFQAGKLMQELAPIVGGKGGGKPDMARGAGNDAEKLPELLEKARELVS